MNATAVMGIINVTPDSFSGDGLMAHKDVLPHAIEQAQRMIADGATMLDIGGESTKPGSDKISTDEEIRRVIPVIAALRPKVSAPLSVDTISAATAEAALKAGADIINDVCALQGDPHMAAVVAKHKATIVLMHNRAIPGAVTGESYDAAPYSDDVVADVMRDLSNRVRAAMDAGIAADKIILDPGIGFGKSMQQNLTLIAHLDRLKTLGFPVLMGVSRKSFIGQVLDLPVSDRLEGTAASVTACVLRGADIIRVHDVKAMARVVKVAAALRDA